MASKIVDALPVTTPARAPKQQSFALAADKPPLFRLSRAEIGRFTVRAATGQSRVDEVVAPAAEEIATGIAAATDLLFAPFPGKQICHLGARGGAPCVVTSIVANRA
jgi:hypothetical protein